MGQVEKQLTTEYTITEQDYVAAMKLFYRLSLKVVLVYVILALILAIFAVAGSPVIQGAAVGTLAGALIVIVLGRLIISPMLARRHYRKYKAIQESIQIELKLEGVTFSTVDGGGIVPWEKVHRWRQNDSYLLIFPMPRLYHIIPKSVSRSGFDVDGLVEKLIARVGPET
jgi:hypothetical protein